MNQRLDFVEIEENQTYLKDKVRRYLNTMPNFNTLKTFKVFSSDTSKKEKAITVKLSSIDLASICKIRYSANDWVSLFHVSSEEELSIDYYDNILKTLKVYNFIDSNFYYLFVPQFKRDNKKLIIFHRSKMITKQN